MTVWKIYSGKRVRAALCGGVERVVVVDLRTSRRIDPRLDLYNHSPTGFEWGYLGSGPAQLALALCADVLADDARALAVYQRVKELVVAPIDDDDWILHERDILDAIRRAEHEHKQMA